MTSPRVLLAHENPDCLKIYGSVLGFEGYDVVIANNGDLAFASLASSTFDLLVSDLYLSSCEDECFVRRVRRELDRTYLPIVVLTGWSTAPHRRLALEEGADLFFALPVGPRQLVQAVRDLLGPDPGDVLAPGRRAETGVAATALPPP